MSSFVVKEVICDERPFLAQAWHFHPEFEICYTSTSSGYRYVGDSIVQYSPGDLVFLGKNLPHGFTTNQHSEQIVVQFHEDFMGKSFFDKPELGQIHELLESSRRGFFIKSEEGDTVVELLQSLLTASGFERIMLLLKMLEVIAVQTPKSHISSAQYSSTVNRKQLKRMQTVMDFIGENFQADIKVKDVAEQINLTESAFYKFIKRHTHKKFTDLVNEYRINHACQLLVDTPMSISQVCYESGYGNLSYFNRRFRETVGSHPSHFRQKRSI